MTVPEARKAASVIMSLRNPTELDFSAVNMAAEWARWSRDWGFYAAARELSAKPVSVQVGTFFNYAGLGAQEVASHFEWAEDDGLSALLELFEAYCNPRRNVVLERYNFHARMQQPGESITTFLAALRSLAKTCDFPDLDNMLRDRLVMGVADPATQRALLRQADLTLTAAVDTALSEEASRRDQRCIGGPTSEGLRASDVSAMSPQIPTVEWCRFCARMHEMRRSQCPAWGKRCNACGGRNHFLACCQPPATRPTRGPASRRGNRHSADGVRALLGNPSRLTSAGGGGSVAAVEAAGRAPPTARRAPPAHDDEEEPLYAVGALQDPATGKSRVFKTLVSASGESLRFLVDSGSECNVLSLNDYVRVTGDHCHRYLRSGVSAIRMYDGSLVSTLGGVSLRFRKESTGHFVVLRCRVVSGDVMPILSLQSSVDLGLIEVKDVDPLDYVPMVPGATGPDGGKGITKAGVLAEFKQVFDTAKPGRVVDGYKIVTDPHVTPVAEPPRRVRVHVRDRLKGKLDELVRLKLISPVTAPTPWVSNLVIVDKPGGDIRICLDPKTLNQAVQREHYPMPTVDEVTTRLTDAKIFSVVDASQAFWQIGLSEESAQLCTFHTPFGRYRWEVLPYGIKLAPELWQRTMHELVAGLRGVEVIADDFIIFGTSESDHDANLRAFLRRAEERSLRLNPEKFKFKVRSVKWMGHILSDQGLKADPDRIKAMTEFPAPTSVPELKRFLGMVGYLSRFLPNVSEVLAPLRQLTQKSVGWYWSEACQRAFDRVKCLLTSAPVLRFYDPRREATVQCDASMSGLGACLLQDGNPVMYCSRALTSAETAYSQIEKELLAITFALVRLDQFLYARPVTVITDHKPLVAIQSKPLGDAPLRLQRMLMAIQRYDYTIVYQPGSQLYP